MRTVRACCCTKPSAFGCARRCVGSPGAGRLLAAPRMLARVQYAEVWVCMGNAHQSSVRLVCLTQLPAGVRLASGIGQRGGLTESELGRACRGCAGVWVWVWVRAWKERLSGGGELGKLNGSYRRHKRCILCVLTVDFVSHYCARSLNGPKKNNNT